MEKPGFLLKIDSPLTKTGRGSAAARRRHKIFGGSLSRRPGRGTVTMTEITITFTLTLTVTVTITQPYLHGNVKLWSQFLPWLEGEFAQPPPKHSRTAQAAARNPVRSAHRAAGMAYRVREMPTDPK